jgi:carbon-monoxide dehydrogenase medium subunit
VATSNEPFHIATSLSDALAALAERGREGAPLAGGTWIMRAPLRGEQHRPAYVCIARLEGLRATEIDDRALRVGSCATHAELASFLLPHPEFAALAQAAANSANPAVRNMATIGGNLCAADFAAADLVPALLCLEAEAELRSNAGGPERMSLSDFLAARKTFGPGTLLTHIIVRRQRRLSAHVRLPLRKAGDYPVAIVSASCVATEDGMFSNPRIAVGSVEPTARLWRGLEDKLQGTPLDPAAAAAAAAETIGDLDGRDGVEAPGWYRLRVLPALVRRAVEEIRHRL